MAGDSERAERSTFRNQAREYVPAVREALWRVDPLHVSPDRDTNASEYDEVASQICLRIAAGKSLDEIAAWVLDTRTEFQDSSTRRDDLSAILSSAASLAAE